MRVCWHSQHTVLLKYARKWALYVRLREALSLVICILANRLFIRGMARISFAQSQERGFFLAQPKNVFVIPAAQLITITRGAHVSAGGQLSLSSCIEQVLASTAYAAVDSSTTRECIYRTLSNEVQSEALRVTTSKGRRRTCPCARNVHRRQGSNSKHAYSRQYMNLLLSLQMYWSDTAQHCKLCMLSQRKLSTYH